MCQGGRSAMHLSAGQVNALECTCLPCRQISAYANREDKWVLVHESPGAKWLAGGEERDGEKRARIVEITRMASCGASDHLIWHNISSRHINSKLENCPRTVYIFFSRFLPRTFLRRSNYCGFIAGINCARRLFGRLKLTTAIYLEHYMPAEQI